MSMMITPQHAARAHELHVKYDELHAAASALVDYVWHKLLQPAEKTADVVSRSAKDFATLGDSKADRVKREIWLARVKLRQHRDQMMLVKLQAEVDQFKEKVAELQAWEIMSPLLDSCPE